MNGRVLDHDEIPLAAARVYLLPAEDAWQLGSRLLAGELLPPPSATVRSDAHGLFQLRIPEPGLWVVRVEAEGALDMALPPRVFLQDETLPVVILSALGRQQRVSVRDPEGRPIPGALIDVEGGAALSNRARLALVMRGGLGWQSLDSWELARRNAFTDSDGSARLPLGEGEEKLRFTVSAPGWNRWERRQALPARAMGETLEARLRRGRQLELEISPPPGEKPSEQAPSLAFLLAPFRPLGMSDGERKLRITLSQESPGSGGSPGSEGSADDLPGEVIYLLDAEGRSERLPAAALAASPPARPSPARQVVRRLSLRGPERVQGRVLSAEHPLSGAWVWVGGLGVEPVLSGEAGEISLPIPWIWLGLPSSSEEDRPFAGPLTLYRAFHSLTLEAAAVDHLPEQRPLAARRRSRSQPQAAVRAEQEKELTLSLRPAVRLHGRVVDVRDQPVEAATIWATASPDPASGGQALGSRGGRGEEDPAAGHAVAWAGPGGTFQLFLAAGEAHRLEASHPGHAPARADSPPLAPGIAPREIRLVLPAGRSAFGTVLNEQERPIRRARVILMPVDSLDVFGRPWRGGVSPLARLQEGMRTLRTDAAGRFEVGDLPPGSYTLAATAPGYSWAIIPGLEVPEERQGPHPLGTVILDPGRNLEGWVVGPREGPVEEATIQYQAEASVVEYILDAVTGQDAGRSGGEVRSAADGSFLIPGRRRGERLEVIALRSGFRRQVIPGVEIPESGEPEPLRIVLEPAAVIVGRVTDRLGDPVAQAQIALTEVLPSLPGMGPTNPGGSGFAFSGEDGRFELDSIGGGRMTLRVRHEAFLPYEHPEPLTLVVGERHPEVLVELERGETLTGRVLDGAGLGVESARLTVFDSQPSRRQEEGPRPASEGVSEADGGFLMEGLKLGEAQVSVRHRDYAEHRETVEIRRGETFLEVELTPLAGFEVSGRVVTQEGEGIAGARILARPVAAPARSEETVTTTGGEFSFPRLISGAYRLRVFEAQTPLGTPSALDTGGPEPSRAWVQEQEHEVEVEGGPVSGVEIRLLPGSSVFGRLLGLDLDDTARAHVMAMAGHSPGRSGQIRFDGSYRIEGLAPGLWEVSAFLPEGKTASGRVEVAAGSTAELDLDFTRGYTLRGSASVEDRPMAGAQIHMASEAHNAWTSTSAQGRFEISGLQAGRYEMRIIERRSGLSHRRSVEVSGDDEIEVRLSAAAVEGFVVDASGGGPLPGSTVSLSPRSAPAAIAPRPIIADAAGAFSFGEVLEGRYWLRAHAPGYGVGQVEVQVPEDAGRSLELALRRTGGIVLRLTTAEGGPWQGDVRVAALDPSGAKGLRGRFSTSEPGRLELTALPPGNWELLLNALDRATTRLLVSVPAGGESTPELAVTLVRAASLVVTLPDPDAVQVSLTLSLPDGRLQRVLSWRGGILDQWMLAAGGAEVSGLPPGSWTLRAEAADGRVWTGTASATAGQRVSVLLQAAGEE